MIEVIDLTETEDLTESEDLTETEDTEEVCSTCSTVDYNVSQ